MRLSSEELKDKNAWICASSSSFGLNFKSLCARSLLTVLFPSSRGLLSAVKLRAPDKRRKRQYKRTSGHYWEKKNVSDRRGQQDDRKRLQGATLLSDCLPCLPQQGFVCQVHNTVQCAVKLLEMSHYLCVLLPTGDSGPVQPQSEELCDHGETLWESPDRLVKHRPLTCPLIWVQWRYWITEQDIFP